MRRQVSFTDPEARALISALSVEDRALMDLKTQLDAMRVSWQLTLRKYAAVRDLFSEKYNVSPYSLDPSGFGANPFQSEGRYRFIRMNPGDAAVQVLRESDRVMELEEIVTNLREGGLAIADARTVSAAALIKKSGIKQLPDGKFLYEADEEIPFE